MGTFLHKLGGRSLASLRSSSSISAPLQSLRGLKLKWLVVSTVIVLALWGELRPARNSTTGSKPSNNNNNNNNNNNLVLAFGRSFTDDNTNTNAIIISIAPGELPGYTGWARPEKTLARFFSIASVKPVAVGANKNNIEGYEYVIKVRCEGHRDCYPKSKYRYNNNVSAGGGGDGGPSLFFLRAYGPAVVSGTVTSQSCSSSSSSSGRIGGDTDFSNTGIDATAGCSYDIRFVFYDPGLYTIEAVLTFSNPPPVSVFPLSSQDAANQQQPHYEGYLLPGFPLLANVNVNAAVVPEGQEEQSAGPSDRNNNNNNYNNNLCTFDDLTETSPTSAIEKARWKVTGKVNEPGYSSNTMNSPVVSKIGYRNNANSLGINMEYQYTNNCRILRESSFRGEKNTKEAVVHAFTTCGTRPKKTKIHIVYIGDSVLRVQKDMLQDLLKGVSTKDRLEFEFSFLSLHGGYRKNQVLGPAYVQEFLQDIQRKAGRADVDVDVKVAVLFNTGLHDIHRLCGSEFKDERPSYLDKTSLASTGVSSFACVDEYRALLRDFLETVADFPATLKVFQTTTSAWPKYGNFGIDWNDNPQDMPLVSDFSAVFNEIAFGVLADYTGTGTGTDTPREKNNYSNGNGTGNSIAIMDGYWITHPRPDNREIGDIGKKLSHPGVEVLSTMARTWVMLIRDRVCS